MRGTNHDLAFERQLLRDRSAKRCLAHIFAHNKRPHGSDINDPKLRQLLSDQCRSASIRSTDVHRAKKYDPAHQGSKKEVQFRRMNRVSDSVSVHPCCRSSRRSSHQKAAWKRYQPGLQVVYADFAIGNTANPMGKGRGVVSTHLTFEAQRRLDSK
jgi:hypothetical protein